MASPPPSRVVDAVGRRRAHHSETQRAAPGHPAVSYHCSMQLFSYVLDMNCIYLGRVTRLHKRLLVSLSGRLRNVQYHPGMSREAEFAFLCSPMADNCVLASPLAFRARLSSSLLTARQRLGSKIAIAVLIGHASHAFLRLSAVCICFGGGTASRCSGQYRPSGGFFLRGTAPTSPPEV